MIANKKEFYGGVALMAGFLVVLVFFFMPLFNGHNSMEYLDNLYNSISKGSAYYIPAMREKAAGFDGEALAVTLELADQAQAENAAKLFQQAGAAVKVNGNELAVDGGLGRVLASAVDDADAMYNNDGSKVAERYGMDERLATYTWWRSLQALDKALKKQKAFQAAAAVDVIGKRAVETAYNYYGVEAQSIGDRFGMVIFSLAFYVIYTLWYGYAILFMFEGWGLRLSH